MIKELNEELLKHYDDFLAFGIILFTEVHPNIIKLLRDDDYWRALDEISGSEIAVFATRSLGEEPCCSQQPSDSLGYLLPIWREPKANEEVLSWFNIKKSQNLPIFVLFVDTDQGLAYSKYPLPNESVEKIYKSLEKMLSTIAACAKTQKDRCATREELFVKLDHRVTVLRIKDILVRLVHWASLFRDAGGI